MLQPKAIANSFAVVGGGLYLVCALWSLMAAESLRAVTNLWAHSVNMADLPLKRPDLADLILGFVTFSIFVWVLGYAVAQTYNYFLHETE